MTKPLQVNSTAVSFPRTARAGKTASDRASSSEKTNANPRRPTARDLSRSASFQQKTRPPIPDFDCGPPLSKTFPFSEHFRLEWTAPESDKESSVLRCVVVNRTEDRFQASIFKAATHYRLATDYARARKASSGSVVRAPSLNPALLVHSIRRAYYQGTRFQGGRHTFYWSIVRVEGCSGRIQALPSQGPPDQMLVLNTNRHVRFRALARD